MTQPFGASALSAVGAGQKTMLFGAGLAASAQGELPGARVPSPPPPSQTQIFGAGALTDVVARADAASARAPTISLPPESDPVGAARPQRPAHRGAPAELPPELLGGRGSSRPGDARAEAPPRKDGLLFVFAILGVLALTATLAYPAWRKGAGELPAEALSLREEATALLRRDDATSREQAIARLRPLVAAHPTHTEARADLALALALELDDLLLDIQRLQVAEERLQRQIREGSYSKAADWGIRVNAMNSEINSLQREREPLTQRIQSLLNETEELQRALHVVPKEEAASATLARVRAQAVHAGVRATGEGITLAERLRGLEGAPQTWAVVALAEYALNANSPPATLTEVSAALAAVREKDRTFLRAYVLGARAALKQGDPVTAKALLDEAMALNPNHALARKLHAWSVASAREVGASP